MPDMQWAVTIRWSHHRQLVLPSTTSTNGRIRTQVLFPPPAETENEVVRWTTPLPQASPSGLHDR